MWHTRNKYHNHPANQSMFLFAPLETLNSYELLDTSNSISNLHELAFDISGFNSS